MKRFSMFGALAIAAMMSAGIASAQTTTLKGIVSDQMCGAHHMMAGASAAEMHTRMRRHGIALRAGCRRQGVYAASQPGGQEGTVCACRRGGGRKRHCFRHDGAGRHRGPWQINILRAVCATHLARTFTNGSIPTMPLLLHVATTNPGKLRDFEVAAKPHARDVAFARLPGMEHDRSASRRRSHIRRECSHQGDRIQPSCAGRDCAG